jgi:hypothetical protein
MSFKISRNHERIFASKNYNYDNVNEGVERKEEEEEEVIEDDGSGFIQETVYVVDEKTGDVKEEVHYVSVTDTDTKKTKIKAQPTADETAPRVDSAKILGLSMRKVNQSSYM